MLIFSSLIAGIALASSNGNLYVCDTTELTNNNRCIFAKSSDTSDWDKTAAFEPKIHDIKRDVADYKKRKVADIDDKDLAVTPKPWTNGDKLVASDTELSANLVGYANAFEIVAPLRDAMMYKPKPLNDDDAEWKKYTKAFTDCKIKLADETHDGKTALSTDNVYAKMKDPDNKDIHHFILQYLEEGAIDLVCLMTDLTMDRCKTIRTANNLPTDGSVTSTCWEGGYIGLYTKLGDGTTTETTTKAPTTAAPTADPTGVPTAAPTPIPTVAPTADPTLETPTKDPTPVPTVAPTHDPTAAPTHKPTLKPTNQGDTQHPTWSHAPTHDPTADPTAVPTADPTAVPTADPTAAPTAAPTATPTATPTNAASVLVSMFALLAGAVFALF